VGCRPFPFLDRFRERLSRLDPCPFVGTRRQTRQASPQHIASHRDRRWHPRRYETPCRGIVRGGSGASRVRFGVRALVERPDRLEVVASHPHLLRRCGCPDVHWTGCLPLARQPAQHPAVRRARVPRRNAGRRAHPRTDRTTPRGRGANMMASPALERHRYLLQVCFIAVVTMACVLATDALAFR